MINKRGWVAALGAAIGLVGFAHGADQEPRWTCAEVRSFVAQYGSIKRAERVARDLGIPEWQISLAKRCLK